MKKVLLTLALFFSAIALNAQYETVVYDAANNNFDNGQPLPAETNFAITGGILDNVDLVDVEIYRNNKFNRPVFTTNWKRNEGSKVGAFQIPINYKLRRNSDYSFIIKQYSSANDEEKLKMKQSVFASLDSYIDGVMSAKSNKIKVEKKTNEIVSDLNSIMEEATRYYISKADYDFNGFSSVIDGKVDQIRDAKLGNALSNIENDGISTRQEAKQIYGEQLIDELKMAVKNEAEQVIDADSYVLSSVTTLEDYPVEKAKSIIGVQIGYGGVFLDGQWKDFEYARSPYIGASFPLANLNLGPKFFRNANLSAGIFLKQFKDEDGVKQSGPIVKRPLYAALGYKVFKFVRFNAGAVMVGTSDIDGGRVSFGDVSFKPFVGLSAEIKLWAKLAD